MFIFMFCSLFLLVDCRFLSTFNVAVVFAAAIVVFRNDLFSQWLFLHLRRRIVAFVIGIILFDGVQDLVLFSLVATFLLVVPFLSVVPFSLVVPFLSVVPFSLVVPFLFVVPFFLLYLWWCCCCRRWWFYFWVELVWFIVVGCCVFGVGINFFVGGVCWWITWLIVVSWCVCYLF